MFMIMVPCGFIMFKAFFYFKGKGRFDGVMKMAGYDDKARPSAESVQGAREKLGYPADHPV